jgi:probable rRNA maturation factor
MKLEIEICGKIGRGIAKDKIKAAIQETIFFSGKLRKNKKTIAVNLAFVESKEIREINRIYRSKNEVTDVLSFSYLDQSRKMGTSQLFLGELVICPTYVSQSAGKNKISYARQLVYVIAHGILHLIGFRHSKKMFAIQDKIAEKF